MNHLAAGFGQQEEVTFDYAAFKEQQYDKLADWVRQQVDMEYIYQTLRGEK